MVPCYIIHLLRVVPSTVDLWRNRNQNFLGAKKHSNHISSNRLSMSPWSKPQNCDETNAERYDVSKGRCENTVKHDQNSFHTKMCVEYVCLKVNIKIKTILWIKTSDYVIYPHVKKWSCEIWSHLKSNLLSIMLAKTNHLRHINKQHD